MSHVTGSEDETAVGRLVVTGVTVPQYGVEGKHAVLYCRSSVMMTMLMLMGDCASERGVKGQDAVLYI